MKKKVGINTSLKKSNSNSSSYPDSETQKSLWVDSTSKKARAIMKSSILESDKGLRQFFNKNKIDFIPINTSHGYIKPLVSFFTRRSNSLN